MTSIYRSHVHAPGVTVNYPIVSKNHELTIHQPFIAIVCDDYKLKIALIGDRRRTRPFQRTRIAIEAFERASDVSVADA